MKLNIKEVEEYLEKLDDFLGELNNLSWSGLESKIKSVTVTHLKSKISDNFKDEVEEREFSNQINQPIEKVEEKIQEVMLEKYKTVNAYRKYICTTTSKYQIMGKNINLDYKALKSIVRNLKDTQEQFYENILCVQQEKRYGGRDGIYVNKDGKKIEFEYDTITSISPIYNKDYLTYKNSEIKNEIFKLEGQLDKMYIQKGIELNPKFLTHKTIYELFS